MYGFNTVLCLGAAVASIDASTCAHFRADGTLSCDEFSHGGDIFDSHWNHAGTGEAQANERIQAFFGDDPWLNQSACQSWCLDRNVLVLGDSVDVQLFHAIEHATAAGRASRAGLARTGEVGSGWRWSPGFAEVKGKEAAVVRYAPERGGGALVFCRDETFESLDGRAPAPPSDEARRSLGRWPDLPAGTCAAWRGDPRRELFGVRVDVVVFGSDARYTRRSIYDDEIGVLGPHENLDRRADRVARHVRAVREAGAEPVIRGIPPTNLLWDSSRRAVNARMQDVARKQRVAYVNLERFGEAALERAARRSNVSAAYAFVEIPPSQYLGGLCPEPLQFPNGTRLEATFADLPLPRAAYRAIEARPTCPRRTPTIMADDTHWMPQVFAFWGQIAVRAIARAARARGS